MRLLPQPNIATNQQAYPTRHPPQGIRSAGGTLSGQPEGGSGPFRSPRKAAGAYPPAGPAAQPSIEQPHVEIEAVTQAEEPSPSGPGGVRGALRPATDAFGRRVQGVALVALWLLSGEPESDPPPGRRSRNILLQLRTNLRKATKPTPTQKRETLCAKGQLSCERTGF